jgi:transposase-like protein
MSNAEVMIEARMIKVAFSMRLDPIRQEKLQRWDGLYQCAECKKQFTVTVGTIFENSHIPLRNGLSLGICFAVQKRELAPFKFSGCSDSARTEPRSL